MDPRANERQRLLSLAELKRARTRGDRLTEIRLQQQAIGVRLRQVLDPVIFEEVPPEWIDLLRRADERRAG